MHSRDAVRAHTKGMKSNSDSSQGDSSQARPSPSTTAILVKLGHTGDGAAVYNRPNSHLHISEDLLREALWLIASPVGSFTKYLIDFGRTIAQTDCVLTGPRDVVMYGRRRGRSGMSRLVVGRTTEPTSYVTLILLAKADEARAYLLISAFPGRAEPEPWDRNATENSAPFWSAHALRMESCDIEGELSQSCPWQSTGDGRSS